MQKHETEICSDQFRAFVFNDEAEAKEWCCDYPDHCGQNVPGKREQAVQPDPNACSEPAAGIAG
jgi:hypothetical protein